MTRDEILGGLEEYQKRHSKSKLAMRFALNTAGSIPVVGGVAAAASAAWSEKDQAIVEEKTLEFLKKTNLDLNGVLEVLEREFAKPSLATFAELLEKTFPDYTKNILTGFVRELHVVLHPSTLNEFEPFFELGFLSFRPTHNQIVMGSHNSVGNSVEEKKRPYGMGQTFIFQFKLYPPIVDKPVSNLVVKGKTENSSNLFILKVPPV